MLLDATDFYLQVFPKELQRFYMKHNRNVEAAFVKEREPNLYHLGVSLYGSWKAAKVYNKLDFKKVNSKLYGLVGEMFTELILGYVHSESKNLAHFLRLPDLSERPGWIQLGFKIYCDAGNDWSDSGLRDFSDHKKLDKRCLEDRKRHFAGICMKIKNFEKLTPNAKHDSLIVLNQKSNEHRLMYPNFRLDFSSNSP